MELLYAIGAMIAILGGLLLFQISHDKRRSEERNDDGST